MPLLYCVLVVIIVLNFRNDHHCCCIWTAQNQKFLVSPDVCEFGIAETMLSFMWFYHVWVISLIDFVLSYLCLCVFVLYELDCCNTAALDSSNSSTIRFVWNLKVIKLIIKLYSGFPAVAIRFYYSIISREH